MKVKTQGISLSFIKYKESSIIAKIYTAELGLISCIVNGVRSKSGKANKIALFQPLTLLDLVVYHKEDQNLKRLSEVSIHFPFSHIPFDFRKSAIAMLLTEILGKVLKEEAGNEQLFGFLKESIVVFDDQKEGFANFHIAFLFRLGEFLGFGVASVAEMLEQIGEVNVDEQAQDIANQLLLLADYRLVQCNGKTRMEILSWLLKFYQLHIENFGEIKSLEILKEVF